MSSYTIETKEEKDFPDAVFEVKVDAGVNTKHKVILDRKYYKQLTKGKITPQELVHKSFEFLLAREPNTSILSEFNLQVIEEYFPEYKKEIKP